MVNHIKWIIVFILSAVGIFMLGADTPNMLAFCLSKLLGTLLLGVAFILEYSIED